MSNFIDSIPEMTDKKLADALDFAQRLRGFGRGLPKHLLEQEQALLEERAKRRGESPPKKRKKRDKLIPKTEPVRAVPVGRKFREE